MELNDHSYISDDSHEQDPRAELFTFFALLMRYPESTFFDREVLDALQGLLSHCRLTDAMDRLAAWQGERNMDELLDDVQVAYTHLFINSVPHVIAPPYASVYMDGDGDLQGKTTEKIRQWYLENGFDVVEKGEPADHIRYQLEFMAALFAEGREETAADFNRTVFIPWFKRFLHRFDETPEASRHPFYEASLQLIHTIVKEEQ
jgi:TorA maturation chaperone TorD